MRPGLTQLDNQTLALAGVFQSASLVDLLSTTGQIDQVDFDCSFNSLFSFDAPTTLDVFGGLSGIHHGLKALELYLSGGSEKSTKSIAYYILTMLKIAKLLKRDSVMASKILKRLQEIDTQSIEFEFSRSNVTAKIGGLYQETISTISPRIIVRGEQSYLSNNESASKIRTLLLAGIRSSILWHQLGGSKWNLLLGRGKYIKTAQSLIATQS
jgi:high frequency lysogenization protein